MLNTCLYFLEEPISRVTLEKKELINKLRELRKNICLWLD